jgi:hypothetical protein
MSDNISDELENMLSAEAEVAKTVAPFETSIGKLNESQLAHLKLIVDSEQAKRNGPDVANLNDGEFKALVNRMIK